jgi:hypothetical protein
LITHMEVVKEDTMATSLKHHGECRQKDIELDRRRNLRR